MHLGVMADLSIQSGGDAGGAGGGGNPTSSSTSLVREYRKGNWTVNETMILIEAKKMDDERRMKRTDSSSSSEVARMNKPAELRWKWVEDYCWRKGCLRSQNQCNDKWDNLMRDYKKVRDYERKRRQQQQQQTSFDQDGDKFSYWKMEKNERKDKMLPTNMLPEIYEALVEVVEKRALASGSSSVSAPTHPRLLDMTPVAATYAPVNLQPQQPPPPPLPPPYLLLPRQHISSTPSPTVTAVVSSPTPIQQVHPVMPPQSHPTLPTVDSDTSEHSESPAKRRRKSSDQHHHHHQEQQGMASASPVRNIDTAAAATLRSSPTTTHEVASAISRSASVIAEALLASNEREERRHRDLLNLQERRLKIEESKTEVNRQGINGLVDAISKLANSIQTLASNKHGSSPSSSRPS